MSNINKIAKLLKVKSENILDKLKYDVSKKVSNISKEVSISESDICDIKNSLNVKLGYMVVEQTSKKLLNEIVKITDKFDGIVICIAGKDKKQVMVAVADKYIEKYHANDILSRMMKKIGGKGGGNKKVATGGSNTGIKEIINSIVEILI